MTDLIHIDEIDRRLIRILQVDADLSQAALAEKAGCSQSSCWRRLQNLEQMGVLGAKMRAVDAKALGFNVNVMCMVRISEHGRGRRAEFESFILSRPEILECYSMSGEWDYQLRIVTRTIEEYEEFLMQQILRQPVVTQSSSQFALKELKYTNALPV